MASGSTDWSTWLQYSGLGGAVEGGVRRTGYLEDGEDPPPSLLLGPSASKKSCTNMATRETLATLEVTACG